MKTLKYIVPSLAATALASVACTDLDLMPESGIITDETKSEAAVIDPGKAAADLTGLYAKMASPGTVLGKDAYNGNAYPDDGGFPLICAFFDMNGPDMTGPDDGYNWLSTSSEWADRNTTYRNPTLRWRIFYQQAKAANDIIRGIDRDTESEELRATLGQALAVRAFDYMNLAPYYQFNYADHKDALCVPIVDENTFASALPRNTVQEVYDFILADLNEAIECLKGYQRSTKANIDLSVAYGLRARAHLAMEMWTEAASDADSALINCDGSLCDGMPYTRDEVSKPTFCTLEDHNWMWGIKMTDGMINGEYASWPAWVGSFSANGYSTAVCTYATINPLLYNKINDTDVRKGWWVDENLHSDNLTGFTWTTSAASLTGDDIAQVEVKDVKMTYLPYTNIKFGFQAGADLTMNGGDWVIMRVEEMLLIQAEAYAKAGNEAKGREILAGFITTYRDPAWTQTCATFADEVWKQRRIELWGEGFAMSDIMRLKKPLVRFHDAPSGNGYPEAYQFNYPAGDLYMLMKIPQVETSSNILIVQNEGGVEPTTGQYGELRDGVTD